MPAPESLEDFVRVGSTVVPLQINLEWGCTYLTDLTQKLKNDISDLEMSLNHSNPEIFNLMSSCQGEEEAGKLQQVLASLKSKSRQKSKHRWHTWRAKLELNTNDILVHESENLGERVEVLNQCKLQLPSVIEHIQHQTTLLSTTVQGLKDGILSASDVENIKALSQTTVEARQSQLLTQRPFFSKWRRIWIRDVFWSQHLGCWGQNTSRIQNKGDYATL